MTALERRTLLFTTRLPCHQKYYLYTASLLHPKNNTFEKKYNLSPTNVPNDTPKTSAAKHPRAHTAHLSHERHEVLRASNVSRYSLLHNVRRQGRIGRDGVRSVRDRCRAPAWRSRPTAPDAAARSAGQPGVGQPVDQPLVLFVKTRLICSFHFCDLAQVLFFSGRQFGEKSKVIESDGVGIERSANLFFFPTAQTKKRT